jgi:hypothetical protein
LEYLFVIIWIIDTASSNLIITSNGADAAAWMAAEIRLPRIRIG